MAGRDERGPDEINVVVLGCCCTLYVVKAVVGKKFVAARGGTHPTPSDGVWYAPPASFPA